MRRLAAALLAVMVVAGCDSTGGDSAEADRAATCEQPELWWADERFEAPADASHCSYLSVCVSVEEGCDGNLVECVSECAAAAFGDDNCGCCGDEACEASCLEAKALALEYHACLGTWCDELDDLGYECGQFGQPLR